MECCNHSNVTPSYRHGSFRSKTDKADWLITYDGSYYVLNNGELIPWNTCRPIRNVIMYWFVENPSVGKVQVIKEEKKKKWFHLKTSVGIFLVWDGPSASSNERVSLEVDMEIREAARLPWSFSWLNGDHVWEKEKWNGKEFFGEKHGNYSMDKTRTLRLNGMVHHRVSRGQSNVIQRVLSVFWHEKVAWYDSNTNILDNGLYWYLRYVVISVGHWPI